MKHLVIGLLAIVLSSNIPDKIDFGSAKDFTFGALNDGVMGGMSKGMATYTEESVKLIGEISLANNGGFSSLKGPFKPIDLSEVKYIKVKYKSEGVGFAMTLETDRRWFIPYFKFDLDKTDGEWKEVKLPIKKFRKYNIGRFTGDTVTISELEKVIRLGFISNEKQEKEFVFEVDYIDFI
mgnify:CR=1 FL=1